MVQTSDKPANTRSKPLASGEIAWFWEVQSKDRKAGCKIPNEALGTDTAAAWTRARQLNDDLAAFRQGRDPEFLPAKIGTFDWLCEAYRQHHRYKLLKPASRDQVERAMDRIGQFKIPGQPRLGKHPLEHIDEEVVEIIYDKLRESGLTRQANYAMQTAGTMWKRVRRRHSAHVPALNPFEGLEMGYKREETQPATWEETLRYIDKAEELGWPQMAFAALACWELLQRPENVFGDLLWQHWRPADRPDQVWVEHGKNDASDWAYLEVQDQDTGEMVIFYPELERLARTISEITKPHGPMIVTRPILRGNQKVAKAWGPMPARYRQKLSRTIADAAGLGKHVTMEAFRHGGMTELGDGELPDTMAQALSRHKQRQTLDRYIHRTGVQKVNAARMRKDARAHKKRT